MSAITVRLHLLQIDTGDGEWSTEGTTWNASAARHWRDVLADSGIGARIVVVDLPAHTDLAPPHEPGPERGETATVTVLQPEPEPEPGAEPAPERPGPIGRLISDLHRRNQD